MIVSIMCVLSFICGLIGFYRQNTFLSIVDKPDFSGEMMRHYFLYTEIYYVLNLLFSSIAGYMIFDESPVFASVFILICAIMAIPRIKTIITFSISQNAEKVFDEQATVLLDMKRKFDKEDSEKCEK